MMLLWCWANDFGKYVSMWFKTFFTGASRQDRLDGQNEHISTWNDKLENGCVQRVLIDGLIRTNVNLIDAVAGEIYRAQTLSEVLSYSQEVSEKLRLLKIFTNVNMDVRPLPGNLDGENLYDVYYKVTEKGNFFMFDELRLSLKTNATIGLKLVYPNVYGNADNIHTEFSFGKANSLILALSNPIAYDPRKTGIVGIRRKHVETPCDCSESGIFSEIVKIGKQLNQTLRLDIMWREVESVGSLMKSSLMHSISLDTRDCRLIPTSGCVIRSTQEIAGFGGHAKFVKLDVSGQYIEALAGTGDALFQVSGGGGFVHSISSSYYLNPMDRFMLGGPLTLRGFKTNGCGHGQEGFGRRTGVYWLMGFHLYSQVPMQVERPLYVHYFANFGNLMSVDIKKSLLENWEASPSTRISYGAGLVYKLGEFVRVEMNYCVPHQADSMDDIVDGIQCGVGVNFM